MTILDEQARVAAKAAAFAVWEEDREWLLNPFRPFWERMAKDWDDEQREAVVKVVTGIADRIRRSVN